MQLEDEYLTMVEESEEGAQFWVYKGVGISSQNALRQHLLLRFMEPGHETHHTVYMVMTPELQRVLTLA